MSVTRFLAFVVSVSFAAGLSIYATIARLGIVAHVVWIDLPPLLSDQSIIRRLSGT